MSSVFIKTDASNDQALLSQNIPDNSKPFLKIGEYLSFKIELLGVAIGWIHLWIEEKTYFNDHLCYHIKAKAYTNRFFKKFYDVEYNVDTYIDAESFYPYQFKKQRRLKQKITSARIDFDWVKKTAVFVDETSQLSHIINNLDYPLQDLLSSMYIFRLNPIKYNKNYRLRILYNQNIWHINIKTGSPQQLEIYRKGTFKVFPTEIATSLNRVILNTNKIQVYFTDDEKRIPILFLIRLPYGQVKGKLFNIPK